MFRADDVLLRAPFPRTTRRQVIDWGSVSNQVMSILFRLESVAGSGRAMADFCFTT
jgi:hypothetical protein